MWPSRIISAHSDNWEFTGGAHGTPSSANVNVDLQTGQELKFAAMLDKAGADRVVASCTDQAAKRIVGESGSRQPFDADHLKALREKVAAVTTDLSSWNFSADAARVTFDVYTVGGYMQGALTCDVPLTILRPLANAGFPLPAAAR